MRRRPRPLVRAHDRSIFAVSAFLLGFAVRLAWVVRVQSPFRALYSDMGGYVERAEGLLAGKLPGDPRILAIWPWGTHAIVALELAVFGRQHPLALATAHAAVGAIPAACAALLAARFTTSRAAVAVSGLAVALWHPLVVYAGFFSSEIWFAAAASLMTLAFARASEGRRSVLDALGAGVALAVAFAVRPQVLLTCGLIVAAGFVFRRRVRLRRWQWAAFALPLALVVAGSATRLHALTGDWALIASYEPVQRLFGATDVRRIEASWTGPDGGRYAWWFSPHTRPRDAEPETVRFEGFVTDAAILGQLRRDRVRDVPWHARLARMTENASLLVVRDLPWPEDDFKSPPFRPMLQRAFADAAVVLAALAVFGLPLLRRHAAAAWLVAAHLATLVATAAVYLPEARYRVPYDPFLVVCASVGVATVAARARQVVARARRRG